MERPDVPHVLTESTTLLKDETVHVAVDGAPSEGTADFFAQRKMDLHAAQDKAGLAKLAAVRADSVSVSNIDSENISGIVAGIANVMKPDGVAYVSKTHDPMTADSDLDAAIAEESEQVEELKSLLEERFGDVEDLGTHFQARDPKPSSFRVSEGTNESLRQADASADVAAYGAFNVTAKQHKAVVSLFEGGNLSTLLHELGHYFRSQLTESENRAVERIMLRENSSLRKRDNGRLDWRHNNSEAEEYFAQEFQRYVSEGKTEANELTSVFEKFKSWLKGTLLRLPNTNKLSNEMRAFSIRCCRARSVGNSRSGSVGTHVWLRQSDVPTQSSRCRILSQHPLLPPSWMSLPSWMAGKTRLRRPRDWVAMPGSCSAQKSCYPVQSFGHCGG